MFAKNCWYIAALGTELGRALTKRTIANEAIVMYRTTDGRPAAFLDRCPHRLVPLSMGRLVGDAIECGYHGITFDCTGKCIRIPGEEKVPEHFRAEAYPLVERYGFVWIWLGEPAKADPSLLPKDLRWQEEPGWCPLADYFYVGAHNQLLIDNLLDLSHEAFLHQGTIGNQAVGETPAKTTIKGDYVEVERFMPNCTPPKLFVEAADFTTNIDRYQRFYFVPPCTVIIEVWAVPAGTKDKSKGLVWWVINSLTPETDRSTHYFWALPRHFKQDDQEMTEMLRAGIMKTFTEDRAMIEAQQKILDRVPLEARTVYTKADQAPARARQIVADMVTREQQAATPSPAADRTAA
jgi:vanillate O-demethylase monooxygenase subunit